MNLIVATVSNEQITVAIKRDSSWTIQFRGGARPAFAAIAVGAIPRNSGDYLCGCIHATNSVVVSVCDKKVSSTIHRNVGWII